MDFLSSLAMVLAGAVQKMRADPRIPDYVTLPVAALLGLGAYALGSETIEWASRIWWQGSILWVLAALGVVQTMSGAANSGVPGLKGFKTNKETS
jgi:hypothetical protein